MGLGFVALVMVPQIVVRSLGVRIWFGHLLAMAALAISSGILYTLALGLFFLSFGGQNQRLYRALLMAFAMSGGILARHFSMPLLEITGFDTPGVIGLLINVIIWSAVCSCALCAACFVMLRRIMPGNENHYPLEGERVGKTDWQMIARLVGLSVVFNLINAAMEKGLTPFFGGITARQYSPHTLTVVAAVCLFSFIAGRAMWRFFRWFLPFAIALFILLPCLVLLEEYPRFILLMSTLVSIFHFSLWIIFTVAIVECYAGGFWLYGLIGVIPFTIILSFLGPVISRIVPAGVGFTVLIMGVSAVAFVFLSLRIIIPKTSPVAAAGANTPMIPSRSFENIFLGRGLSKREMEVANLMVIEGLSNAEIGKRLFISPFTVRDHLKKIYKKFEVKKRGEFVALLYKSMNK